MAQLVIIKNAFEPWNGRVVKNVSAGTKFSDIIIGNNLLGIELRAVSNGSELTEVDDYVVQENDIITVSPIVGKGSGKKIFGIIAMIGISIATAGAAHGILAAKFGLGHTFLGYLAVAAVSTVGAFLCNAIQTKMMGNNKLSAYDSFENDQTYGWNGVQTMEGQNNPITMTYGKVKSGGQYIGKYINVFDDKEYLNMLISAGEGPLTFSDIKINDNDKEYFSGVNVETREGTNDQSVIPYFNDTIFTKELSYQILDNPIVETVQGNGTQGIIVKLECSNGLYYANDSGGLDNAWVKYTIEYKLVNDDTWTLYAENAMSGKQTSAIRREYRIDNLVAGEYQVRVTVTGRSHSVTNNRASTRVWWNSLSSIVYDDFCYPNIALLGIRALATDQLNGNASVTFVKERSKVWVYNPYTAEYEQKNANNPAWACYDFLHLANRLKNVNTGEYEFEVRGVPAKLMLYNQFEEWANFCEAKMLTVNIEITQIGELLETVNNSIACIGRGIVIRFGTKYGCVWDSVKQPVQMFGMGNIIAGSFKEDFLPTNDRANAVEVTFMNADHDFSKEIITIYGENYDTDATEKMSQISYLGITNYEQAYREAKYQLYSNQYLIRTVSFQANVDAIACTIGDVIMVAHDVPMWAKSGRLYAIDYANKLITLPIELEDISGAYRLMYRTVNDNIYTIYIDVISSENGYTIVKSKNEFDENDFPQVNDVFDFALVEIGSKPFVVKEISRASDFTRNISCIEYNENIYNERYDIPTIDYSSTGNVVPAVYNINATSCKYSVNGGYAYRLEANWECTKECTYNVFLSTNGELWNVVASGLKEKSYNADISSSIKYIKVVAVDNVVTSKDSVAEISTKDYVVFPSVRNIDAYSRYRELSDDVARYDICVSWDKPIDFLPYMQAQVWYKNSNAQGTSINRITEGVPADELGYNNDWIYGGQGYTSAVISQAIVGDIYQISVCVQDTSGMVQQPDEGTKITIRVEAKSETPNTPNGLSVSVDEMFNVSWDEIRNSDIKYYELRKDVSVGADNAGLIVRTTECEYSTNSIAERNGTLYLFAVNVYGKISAPAVLEYSFAKPNSPTLLVVTPKLQSVELVTNNVPANCLGVRWFFDNETFTSQTEKYLYSAEAGVHTVNVCYYDYFGDGYKYGDVLVTVSAYIDPDLIEEKSLGAKLLDDATQQALEKAKTAAQAKDVENIVDQQIDPMGKSIATIVANLSKNPAESGYSAITQLAGGIQLTVSKGEAGKGSFINLTNKTLTLDANLITIGNANSIVEIPGTTITNTMLAGNISADKIASDIISAKWANVTQLDSLSADQLSLTRISPSGGQVWHRANTSSDWILRVRWGMW